jgi:3-dehydroquinate dehydratase/shikimate dehydrogenase
MPSLPRTLPRICVALGVPSASQLHRAAEREYKDGSTFLEFRLDYLPDPAAGIEVLRKFRRTFPDSLVLATCRHHVASGHFKGSVDQQAKILEDALRAGATLVDLEVESAEKAHGAVFELRQLGPVCVSYHNFEKTPALEPVLRRLRKHDADVYKIAINARKPTDNLRLVEFSREHHDCPLIVLAMSEVGVASRILSAQLGSLFTYAAPMAESATAPGQISAKLMRGLYRSEKLTKQTHIYGVIASPVAHSKSPLIHNRAFHARRVDAVYLPFLVAAHQLTDWMKFAAAMPVHGFSVTIPHKQNILRHLDIIAPLAKRIGAVNTVWRKAGKWRGTNTDTEGVLKPLSRHLRLAHSSILIAGYGGAARAAAIALGDASAQVTITGRNMKTAQALAAAVKGEAITLREAAVRHFDALVHATPLGMLPNAEGCLFNERIPADIVFDMVYNPRETLLLKRAAQQGLKVIPGIEMLLEQAAHQFEIWTGDTAPRAVMREALEANQAGSS